jgi:hypothetical protein
MACLVETFDFYVDDFNKVKEVTKVVFEVIRSTNLPSMPFYIGTRKTQSDSITWSSALSIDTLDSNLSYFTRAEGLGRYIRFKWTIANTATNYVSQFLLMSLTKVEDNVDANATK